MSVSIAASHSGSLKLVSLLADQLS